MKVGLKAIPTLKDLETAYDLFLHPRGLEIVSSQDFARLSQWTRFDSRLAEICVDYLSKHWNHMNPTELNGALVVQPWPNVIGVLMEFCELSIDSKSNVRLFRLWKRLVSEGFAKANWEQFFIGQRRIAGNAMFEDARFSLAEYRKWGYLSREIPFNKQRAQGVLQTTHSYDSETREQVLRTLLESHPRITTEMYLNAIGNSLSRRQAERDLLQQPFLHSIGKTRGRFFVRRKG